MTTLARSQERELRSWLWGGARAADRSLLSTAMNDAAAEVERTHRVAIDVVTTGDCRLDEPVHALVLAAREAMVNAATHSGAGRMSVFVETDANEVSALRACLREAGAAVGLDSSTINALTTAVVMPGAMPPSSYEEVPDTSRGR